MRSLFPPKRQKLNYIYLAEFLVPACYLAWLPHAWMMVLGGCLLIVFAGIYIVSTWVGSRGMLICIALEIMLMWTMTATLHPGFFATLFWPAAAIAYLKRWRRPVMLTVLIGGSLIELQWLANLHHVSLLPYLPVILSGIFSTIITTASVAWSLSSLRTKEALKQAEATIERLTKTAERERISQDLHDVMGHELAMIALKAQVAKRMLDRDRTRAAAELDDIGSSAKQALARVRAYIADVVTPQLEEEWTAAAKLLQAASIRVEADVHAPELPCDAAAMTALAMCLREAVTNTVRHSQARNVRLSHGATDSAVWLCIEDDGAGFGKTARTSTLEDAQANADTHTSVPHGLSGMRARLAAVGGRLEIGSNGTWLTPEPHVSDVLRPIGSCIRLIVPTCAVTPAAAGANTSLEGLS